MLGQEPGIPNSRNGIVACPITRHPTSFDSTQRSTTMIANATHIARQQNPQTFTGAVDQTSMPEPGVKEIWNATGFSRSPAAPVSPADTRAPAKAAGDWVEVPNTGGKIHIKVLWAQGTA